MDIKELLQQYEKDIDLNIDTLDVISLSIPKKLNKYQIHFYQVLESLASTNEKLDIIYHDAFLEWKLGHGEYANINFSATEIQKILKTDTIYLTQATKVVRLENELKITEEMMSNVRSLGYAVNNRVALEKIKVGLI